MTSSVMVGQSLFGQELFWTVELFISLWFQAGRGTSSDAMGDADFFNNSMYTIKMLPTNFKKMQSESAATHHHDFAAVPRGGLGADPRPSTGSSAAGQGQR